MNAEALGALARHAAAKAASGGNASKTARRRCARQRGPCLAAIEDRCASTIDPGACEASLTPCCAHFAGCNAGTGLLCLFNVK